MGISFDFTGSSGKVDRRMIRKRPLYGLGEVPKRASVTLPVRKAEKGAIPSNGDIATIGR